MTGSGTMGCAIQTKWLPVENKCTMGVMEENIFSCITVKLAVPHKRI